MKCKMKECFNCKYEDCINDSFAFKKPSAERAKKAIERRKKLREERMVGGWCINCGKRKTESGYKMCSECRLYFRLRKEESNRKKGVLPKELLDGVDICAKCGKREPVNGYKLCERCLKSSIEHLEKTPTHNGKKQVGGFTNEHETFWTNKEQEKS